MTTKWQTILKRRQRRNTIPMLQAGAVVVAALAVMIFAFKYHYDGSDQKRQNTVLSVIPARANEEFFYQLDLRDPSLVYAISSISPDILSERDSRRRAEYHVTAVAPEKLPEVKLHDFKPAAQYHFPVSIRQGISPQTAAAMPGKTVKTATAVITPQGKVMHLTALADLKRISQPTANSVINISRNGNHNFYRVMASCGVNALDAAAGRELLRHADAECVYTVIWSKKEGKK